MKAATVLRSTAFGSAPAKMQTDLLSESLFRNALRRERLRADRFDDVLVLLTLTLNRPVASQRWRQLVDALSHTQTETDVVGWLEEGAVLGLIRTLSVTEAKTAPMLGAAVRRELAHHLPPDGAESCSIRLEVYSPQSASAAPVFFESPARRRKPQERARAAAKRALDVVGSSALLLAFSPVFLCISILVKLTSRGPVFFRQQRIGEGGRPFMMIKFRTMQVNADERIHQQYVESFINSSGALVEKSVVFKLVDDPRVTRIGHFLRRSSLDEFPQFWNVLKGEMSLVGPRPALPYEVASYKGWHRRRLFEAKPGITGLWQVTGRSRTTFDEMVRLDLRYAKNHSLWTDLRILLATPKAVLSGNGAH